MNVQTDASLSRECQAVGEGAFSDLAAKRPEGAFRRLMKHADAHNNCVVVGALEAYLRRAAVMRLEAVVRENGSDTLIRLMHGFDAMGMLLCSELSDSELEQARQLALTIAELPAGSETDRIANEREWDRYYRMSIGALHLDGVREAARICPTVPRIDQFVLGSGRTIKTGELAEWAAERKCQVVFQVAADLEYIKRYGRIFLRSVLRNCDVSCVIMLQYVGDATVLPQIIQMLGDGDERIVLCADGFDPSLVNGVTLSNPPRHKRGLAAFYQAARYRNLSWLVDCFRLPVIVTDIDMVLQRGIADLLSRHENADVVLKRNRYSLDFRSYIAAGLIMVRPSAAGRTFAEYLAAYLDRALSAGEIDRWLDQVGLCLAFHHIVGLEHVHVDFFDAKDLNETTHNSYVENDCRFYAWTHNFDLDSLPAVFR